MNEIRILFVIGVIVLNVLWVRSMFEKKKKKRNTYRVVTNKPVPAFFFDTVTPKPGTAEYIHLLPMELVVVTKTRSFFRIEQPTGGWIRGKDLDATKTDVIADLGALLIDDEGKETGEFLRYCEKVTPVEHVSYGFVEARLAWVDMKQLQPMFPQSKKK